MNPEEASYPPAPWRSAGTMWAAELTAQKKLSVPRGLSILGDPRRLVVLLVRYREGAVTYDEFMVTSPARAGFRPGLWIHAIWVDSSASLAGGRHIWGVPKELARFEWDGPATRIFDHRGPIAGFRFGPSGRHTPRLPALAPGFGHHQHLMYFAGRLTGHIARQPMHLTKWSHRLPGTVAETAKRSFVIDSFHMTVPAPRTVRDRTAWSSAGVPGK
ncbi:acetoacetate decarboxylase family protein [Streptomyces iconiensis]|uniref:Acetoacetate decarboxylase family protein n=1 Tax=Streptomyces iconiensis TaxID=1384038 RepID=A0ABT7A3D2_9ACTN|nr:acetoacetate decarboxylase family protein [Streptomyces iconiensis]MDJ1135148.1 acetoacetate decarboxylase family protein [Streptomyces iconiensis]